MQNCPGCQLLMEDDEQLCASCAGPGRAAGAAAGSSVPPLVVGAAHGAEAPVGGAGSTALLDPPAQPSTHAAPTPTLQYRQPGRSKRVAGWVVVLGLLAAAALVLGVMATRHQGPLADVAVDAGLIAPPPVDVPDQWVQTESEGGRFRVVLPASAEAVDEPLDPANPAAGGVFRYEATLGDGGSTAVVSTDTGGAVDLSVVDDPAGFQALVDLVNSIVVQSSAQGVETVRRPVQVPNGRAVDVVVVDDEEALTTRARYVLAGGRLYAIVTSGVDEGADALDEVHARVLDTFEITD